MVAGAGDDGGSRMEAGDDGAAVAVVTLAASPLGDADAVLVVAAAGALRPMVERVLGTAVRALGATMCVRVEWEGVNCVWPSSGHGGW
jgi:hypothetical protein